MNKPHLVVLLLLLFCSSIYAQKTLPVIASTDKSKVLLGEQFDLVVGARLISSANTKLAKIGPLRTTNSLRCWL